MRTRLATQHGATLLVVLVMLVMITLFVLSMIRLSNTNLRVVGNMQSQRALESGAQQAIEEKIGSIAFFNPDHHLDDQWLHRQHQPAELLLLDAGHRLQRHVQHLARRHQLGDRRQRQRFDQRQHDRRRAGRQDPPAGRQLPLGELRGPP